MEFDKIKSIISEVLSIDADGITEETTFVDDLGADSLDIFQIIMAIEEEFEIEIPTEEAEKITTVGDAVEQIKKHCKNQYNRKMDAVAVSICLCNSSLFYRRNDMEQLKEFQKKIGYQFQQEGLLRQALTHSSYANEHRMKKLSDNERLEFLGDAVLEIVTSDFLYHEHTDVPEGELTRVRASIVCEQTLAFCTRALNLGDYLFLGKGEDQTGGRKRKSILSDAFEAIIGAIYLDGGFANAKEFIHRFVLNNVEHMQLFYDSKTILQEIVQGDEHSGKLEYVLVEESGPDHNKNYKVEARIGNKSYGCGEGHTKKAAEQEAAYQSILELRKKDK